MLKKILSLSLTLALIIVLSTRISAYAEQRGDDNYVNRFTVNNIRGMIKELDLNEKAVNDNSEFNYILDRLSISLYDNFALINTEIDDMQIEFNPMLHRSQIGNNKSNKIIGVDSEPSYNFKLTRFIIEENAELFDLIEANEYMEGSTVISLAFYNELTNQIYSFQFRINDLNVPELDKDNTDMSIYELANFSALPYEQVAEDFQSLKLVIENESNLEVNRVMERRLSDIENGYKKVFDTNTDSEKIEWNIDNVRNRTVSTYWKKPSVVPDIDDTLYKSRKYGWEFKDLDYSKEGNNAARTIGYAIYHMPMSDSSNTMNYVMRFESVTNYNFNSQQFTTSFKITHNLWVQYVAGRNLVQVFDERPSNARIKTTAKVNVKIPSKRGSFTHYQSSGISHGSFLRRVARVLIYWVPKLSTLADTCEELISGTKVQTGAIHPTDRYSKKLEVEQENLLYPGDHVTIQGIGTGIKNITYGYHCEVFVK